MTLEFKINFDPEELIPEPGKIRDNLQRGMVKAQREIVKRTQEGRGVDGSPHSTGYSAGYAKKRAKAGRQTAVVDHTFTGDMLNAMTTEARVENEGAIGEIYFANADAAAKAQFNNERREFFGLSDNQKQEIEDTVKDALPK